MVPSPVEKAVTPERIPLRIRFAKRGNLQYISHLDLVRTFTRLLIRSGLPVWYTEGYHPIPKLTFAMSLSVGAESVSEFLDVKLLQIRDPADCRRALEAVMPPELEILDAYFPSTKFTEIAYSVYHIGIHTETGSEGGIEKLRACLDAPELLIEKRTKSGPKQIDIKGQIYSCSLNPDGENLTMDATLCAGAADFLNPELLIRYLKENGGILTGDPSRESYSILRTDLLRADGRSFR